MAATLILYRPQRNPHGGFPRQREDRRIPCGSTDAAIRAAYAMRRDPMNPHIRIQVVTDAGELVRDHEWFDGAWRNQLPKVRR